MSDSLSVTVYSKDNVLLNLTDDQFVKGKNRFSPSLFVITHTHFLILLISYSFTHSSFIRTLFILNMYGLKKQSEMIYFAMLTKCNYC